MEDSNVPPLSEAQMEIMNVVWEMGEATAADVWKALAKRRPVAKTTIQTLIMRLADKGWLTYRAEGKTFVYSASVERQSAIKTALRRLVDVAFKGSPAGLVHTLLADPELTPEEASRIRQMISEAEDKP